MGRSGTGKTTLAVDLNDNALTENTRAVYPDTHIPNASVEGSCDHPRNIFLLTCDALGVMPPIACRSPELAVYAFLCGYTSKFNETESDPVEMEDFSRYEKVMPENMRSNTIISLVRYPSDNTPASSTWPLSRPWMKSPLES